MLKSVNGNGFVHREHDTHKHTKISDCIRLCKSTYRQILFIMTKQIKKCIQKYARNYKNRIINHINYKNINS